MFVHRYQFGYRYRYQYRLSPKVLVGIGISSPWYRSITRNWLPKTGPDNFDFLIFHTIKLSECHCLCRTRDHLSVCPSLSAGKLLVRFVQLQ